MSLIIKNPYTNLNKILSTERTLLYMEYYSNDYKYKIYCLLLKRGYLTQYENHLNIFITLNNYNRQDLNATAYLKYVNTHEQ